jgi:sulfatase maturation enzyme AslB (radical SAM superfamily)
MSASLLAQPDVQALQLVLTAQCNLRCSYCYQTDKKNRQMDWSIARAAIDRLLASRRSEVEVLFIGGEPLSEFSTIVRSVEYIAERKRPEMSIRFAVVTNGLLLGETETEFFVKNGFHLQLSFDGVPGAQRLRGEHTFDKLDALLDRLHETNPYFYTRQLKIASTVLPETVQWLGDSVEYFLHKGVGNLSLAPQITGSADWKPHRITELENAFDRVFRVSLEHYRRTGQVPLECFRKTEDSDGQTPSQLSMCGVGRAEQIAVDVDGQVHGCATFVESYQTFPTTFLRSRVEAMRLGDLRDPNFRHRLAAFPEAVRRAEIFDHKEQKYSSYGRCSECKYLTECSICPMSIGRDGGNDPRRIPDFPCAFNLVALKFREQFPRMRSLSERLAGPVGWPGMFARSGGS